MKTSVITPQSSMILRRPSLSKLSNLAIQLVFVLLVACIDEEPKKPISIQFSDANVHIGEGASINITMILSEPALQYGTVSIRINTNTVYGRHYTMTPEPVGDLLTIGVPMGESSIQFSLTSMNDEIANPTKVLTFILERVSAGLSLGTQSTMMANIGDDDVGEPDYFPLGYETMVNLSVPSETFSEGITSGIAVKVSISKYVINDESITIVPTAGFGNVLIKIVSGNAVYGVDFTTVPAAVDGSIPISFYGTQDTTIMIIPANDNKPTPSRFISVSISEATGELITGSHSQFWLEITDDEPLLNRISWTKIEGPRDANLASAEFYSEDKGFIMSYVQLYKTTDGGLHWNTVTPDPSVSNVGLVPFFINEDVGFMSGAESLCGGLFDECVSHSKIFKTTNGGTTWSTLKEFSSDFTITSLHFISETTGIIGTSSAQILRTTDGGITWTSRPPSFGSSVFDLVFVDANTGYARTKERILKTSDAGESWTTSFQATSSTISSLSVSPTNTLFATWSDCSDLPDGLKRIFRSNDGVNWSPVSDCMVSETIEVSSSGLSVGLGLKYWTDTSILHVSSDNGSTWSQQSLPDEVTAFRDIAVASDKIVYAVGTDGLVYKGVFE